MPYLIARIIELPHRIMCRLSPTYNANSWALDLRARGYDCPPGTVLAGVTVTR
jgi:hypothetical protein